MQSIIRGGLKIFNYEQFLSVIEFQTFEKKMPSAIYGLHAWNYTVNQYHFSGYNTDRAIQIKNTLLVY